ncbi:hypothetical protein GCM10009118_22690 [Wandonia haliotis]|uniref:Uncharacterized protein n=1 Tax=Wandonia haliotis TaxID=574963 RepID=A0ABN1MRW9_9FLAO
MPQNFEISFLYTPFIQGAMKLVDVHSEGLSSGKNPVIFEAVGAGISVVLTIIGNKIVNDQIGE